ncbi:serine/threonine-protein phosphatase 7 long form homolog [Vigna radiata var. radiata]|uniref:Serine/threonine-protein phosphatase 7 long form homolog n=1 Tax=Vigna radiata var. radiata TaxID=3916 RepID=A0A1S3VGK0_VIGRR|nr:serine/threonine-protein phosphatase 7 long form homolog [Vigna radiata var. radiata]
MPEPHVVVAPVTEEAEFGVVSKLRHLKIDHELVTTLVERWRPETHTFHLPTGECTITLQDVSLQLGLRVDGPLVIGPIKFDWEDMCDTLLRITPIKGESLVGSTVKLKWLWENMLPVHDGSSLDEIHAHARAYILGLIGGEMCRATDRHSKPMRGCASLLQSWAWFRMPFIAPISRLQTLVLLLLLMEEMKVNNILKINLHRKNHLDLNRKNHLDLHREGEIQLGTGDDHIVELDTILKSD